MWRTRSRPTVHGVGQNCCYCNNQRGAQIRAQILLTIGSNSFGTPFLDRGQNITKHLHRDNKIRVKQREGKHQERGGRCKHSRRNILPGCGEYNGDAHRETLIVDTALQSICVQSKLDVLRHGISQQEQPKIIIDVHSSCRRSFSKELSDDA